MSVVVRWPDGREQDCWSPSLVMHEHLAEGEAYTVTDFTRRAVHALGIASDRVRAKHGFACTAAAATAEQISRAATAYAADDLVEVVRMWPPLPAVPATAPTTPHPQHPGAPMTTVHTTVAVVGGGQAGLATSWCLTRDGIDHVVLEAATAAHEWADTRWDNFTLVTPNWHCRLPGYAYDGPDPDGFMTRDEVVAWLGGYAATFDPPLREHTRVTALRQGEAGGFVLESTGPDGETTWSAEHVVVATGGYHVPIVPPWAAALDPGLTQLESAHYKRAADLPDGGVLVVGSGQSGTQIAEDLHLEGREVHLALGDAPRVARTYRGRDCMTWLADMGLYDTAVAQYPGGLAAREKTNHYVTGRDGGRDLDLRLLASQGMRLHGLLAGGRGTRLEFRPTLTKALDAADATYNSICADIDRWIEREGIDAPPPSRYSPVWTPDADPLELDLAAAGVTSVVWAIGYRPDYRWVGVGAFDGSGRPTHHRGVTAVPGLSFLGLPWLHTWGSGRFLGIARDAEHVAATIRESVGARPQVRRVS